MPVVRCFVGRCCCYCCCCCCCVVLLLRLLLLLLFFPLNCIFFVHIVILLFLVIIILFIILVLHKVSIALCLQIDLSVQRAFILQPDMLQAAGGIHAIAATQREKERVL